MGHRKCLATLAAIIMIVPAVALITYSGPSSNSLPVLEIPYNEYGLAGHSQPGFKNNKILVLPSSVQNYTEFELLNNQNKSTPVPFDLEIKVDSSALSSYESHGLSNVEWFTSNGTIIPSWIQCNPSSTSTCTVYWLKLNFSIPADSNTSIGMGFEPVLEVVIVWCSKIN